jgi:hypothetical protein
MMYERGSRCPEVMETRMCWPTATTRGLSRKLSSQLKRPGWACGCGDLPVAAPSRCVEQCVMVVVSASFFHCWAHAGREAEREGG